MKKKTLTLFLLILLMLFVTGCTSKISVETNNTASQSTEVQTQNSAARNNNDGQQSADNHTTESEYPAEELEVSELLTPEQLVAEGMDYLYSTNGKLYNKETAKKLFQKAADQGAGQAFYYLGEVVKRSDDQDRFDKALRYYEKAVELGCDLGLLGKGDLLEYGRGMDRDSEQAKQLYEEALNRGCVLANIDLGDYYRDGVGIDRDYLKALEYYSAFLNDSSLTDSTEDVYARIGDLYYTGIAGIDRNYQEAIRWFTKGRESGKAHSIAALGDMYYSGYGVTRNYDTALSYYEEAADMGNGYAMCQCARWYVNPNIDTAERSPKKAERWLLKAAETGYPDAYSELGLLYLTNYNGLGSESTMIVTKPMTQYLKGIKEGGSDSMRAMGDLYSFLLAEQAEKDAGSALKYYEDARFAGNLDVFYNLGKFYENQMGDGMQAVEWYTKGAELGNPACMQSLGNLYFYGFNGEVPVGQSMTAGREWFTKAAEAGNTSAMVSLGNIHYFGFLGQLDVHRGHELFSEAAARGDGFAMWCIGHRYQGRSLIENLELNEEVDRACYWYAKAIEVYGKANSDYFMEYIDGLILYTSLDQETADRIMRDVHENFRIG